MSNPKLATALVVPFEHLRMSDVDAVGGNLLSDRVDHQVAVGIDGIGSLRELQTRVRHAARRSPRS